MRSTPCSSWPPTSAPPTSSATSTPRTAREGAEWVTRLIVSSVFGPCPVDLGDPAVAAVFLTTYVLPGLTAPSLVPSAA